MTEMQLPASTSSSCSASASSGEVWLARERATGLPVALKRLRPGADLAARDRLRREAAVLAGVDHPHVVRLRGGARRRRRPGAGPRPRRRAAAWPGCSRPVAGCSAAEVVTIAVPLAQALAAVHAQGLVHGDVTPANVLFAADGRPMLSDLGIARLLGSPAAEVGGTGGFLDPAGAGTGAPGPASDVHGLAATCLAALTGRPPYDELGARLQVPPGTPPALADGPGAGPRARPGRPADRRGVRAGRLRQRAGRAGGLRRLGVRRAGSGAGCASVRRRRSRCRRPIRSAARPAGDEPASPAAGAVAHGCRGGRGPAAARARTGWSSARAAAALVVGLAVLAGVAWSAADQAPAAAGRSTDRADRADSAPSTPARSGRPAAQPTAQPGRAQSEWAGTLAALDADRSRAFAAGDPERLARRSTPPDAPALRPRHGRAAPADRRRAAGRGAAAGGHQGRRWPGGPRGGCGWRSPTCMPAYRIVDEGGTVVERRPGRGGRSWTVVLARDGERWRVYDVVRG